MALHHLFQMLRFLGGASKYASPDEDAIAQAESEAPRQVSFHKRIVAISVSFGLVGGACGVGLLIFAAGQKTAAKDAGTLLLAPLIFAVAGLVFGVAMACLFAPRSFLTGPVGQKWMQLIGTQSIVVARVVCFLFTMLLVGFISLLVWATWSDSQRHLF